MRKEGAKRIIKNRKVEKTAIEPEMGRSQEKSTANKRE